VNSRGAGAVPKRTGVAPKTPVRSGTARKQFCPETFTMAEENKAVAVGEKCLLYKHPINKFQLC